MNKIEIVYQDENVLAINKPSEIVVFSDEEKETETVMTLLLEEFPELKNVGEEPRHGAVHRLDRDTTGILLIAKNNQSLSFFQKQFKERKVVKRYIALVAGHIKQKKGIIKTLIGRSLKDRKKQKAFSLFESKKGRREAITEYKVLKHLSKGNKKYTLLEVEIKTGRKHQIRVHLTHIGYPIVGDKTYKFRKQSDKLARQFLHAGFLRINLPNNKTEEFASSLPKDLNQYLENLNEYFE